MHFLPKKEERYFAALRLTVQKSVLKHGMTDQNIRRLKKIYLAEAVFQTQTEPVDLAAFSDALLGSSLLLLLQRGVRLALSFRLSGVFAVYRRAYAALLILLAKNACDGCEIRIQNTDASLKIDASAIKPFEELQTLVGKLGGYFLKASGKGGAVIFLPVTATEETPRKDENEWYYITDCFSPVNILFESKHTPT